MNIENHEKEIIRINNIVGDVLCPICNKSIEQGIIVKITENNLYFIFCPDCNHFSIHSDLIIAIDIFKMPLDIKDSIEEINKLKCSVCDNTQLKTYVAYTEYSDEVVCSIVCTCGHLSISHSFKNCIPIFTFEKKPSVYMLHGDLMKKQTEQELIDLDRVKFPLKDIGLFYINKPKLFDTQPIEIKMLIQQMVQLIQKINNIKENTNG